MKKAFTLMELLVVISIIALLMGILMPSLATAKAQAKAVVCRSNMRQLLLANFGYSLENDGYYVAAAKDMYLANAKCVIQLRTSGLADLQVNLKINTIVVEWSTPSS